MKKKVSSLDNYPIITMIYYLYKEYLPDIIETPIQGRLRSSNVLTGIGGEFDNGATATTVSIITMTSEIPLVTKASMTSTKISMAR